MPPAVELDPVVARLARAVGLLDADGHVDSEWLDHPLAGAGRALTDPGQRAALQQLLDDALPGIETAAGERWHPLLDPSLRGNVYLTVSGAVIGVAASIATPPADETTPSARGVLRMPLLEGTDGTLRALPGTADGSLTLALDAEWPAATGPTGVGVEATLHADGEARIRFGVDGLGEPRLWMNPAAPGPDAVRVVQALVRELLAEAGAPAARVADHLPGVLGLVDGLPPLALERLASDPGAFAGWLRTLAEDPETLRTWFTHLAGLLGAGLPGSDPGVEGSGTGADPLAATLLRFAEGAALRLTLGSAHDPATGVTTLLPGVEVVVDGPHARLEAAATLVAIPLAGTAGARPVPEASLALRVPGGPAPLVASEPDIAVRALHAGASWTDGRLLPLLSLEDVVIGGVRHARLDLTNANAVVDAGIETALRAAVGTSAAGQALLALAGFEAPSSDPGSPHRIDAGRLLTAPTAAIADVHRAILDDPAHPWSHLLGELGALLGLITTPAGAGTEGDPWRLTIAREGPAELQLTAWDARSDAAQDTPLLRLGLRLRAGSEPWEVTWTAALLGVDLPPGRASTVALFGGQRVRAAIAPLATSETLMGTSIEAAEVSISGAWEPGRGASWEARVDQLVLTAGDDAAGPLALAFPGGFDSSLDDLGLGVGAEAAVAAFRILAGQALLAWGDVAGLAIGALAGVHRQLAGLPPDWPLLAAPDPGRAGSLLDAPVAAVRRHVVRVMTGVSADGTPFAVPALTWLAALLGGTLPARPDEPPPQGPPAGAGTSADPWLLAVPAAGVELALSLAPDGPPVLWTRIAAGVARAAGDGASLLRLAPALGARLPALMELPGTEDTDAAGAQLDELLAWIGASDGIVPLESQLAVDPGWEIGPTIDVAHHDAPSAPAAIAAIRARLDGWAPGPRAVLLLGPPFADHRVWHELLAAVDPGRDAGAHFELRTRGAGAIDAVTARASWYTANLADADRAPDALAGEIGAIVGRIRALTGQGRVYIVAHSTAGLAAVSYARSEPDRVGGLITLATPHAGSTVAPLTDPELADAVSAASMLAGAVDRPLASSLAWLHAAADGWLIARDGSARRAPFPAFAFAAPVAAPAPAVPRLALGTRVTADARGDLAAAAADRALDAADTAAAPTHLVIGTRTPLAFPPGGDDGLSVEAAIHMPLAALALEPPGAAPPSSVAIVGRVRRRGGLHTGDGARVRAADLGVRFSEADGGARPTPIVVLHDAAVGGPPAVALGLEELLERIRGPVSLPGPPPASGSAAAGLESILAALGVVRADRGVDLEALRALATRPAEHLRNHVVATLDRLAAVLDQASAGGGRWRLAGLPGPTLEVTRDPWRLHSSTGPEVAIAPMLAAALDLDVSEPELAARAELTLALAGMQARWSATTGILALSGGRWLPETALLPPDPRLAERLAAALPPLAISAALSAAGEAVLGPGTRTAALVEALTAPADWFGRTLGAEDGAGLDADRLNALLEALGAVLGLEEGRSGLGLPGGLLVRAEGAGDVDLLLEGELANGDDALALGVGVRIGRTLTLSPVGQVRLELDLPGDWERVAVAFGASAAGIELTVEPGTAAPIRLLPTFDGFGALAAGAVQLLPRVLQAIVEALRPPTGPPTDALAGALELATAFGLYADDDAGFEDPTRAAELARMLSPDWWESQDGVAAAAATALARLLGPSGPLAPPLGVVAADGGMIRWRHEPGDGAAIAAALGWAGGGPVLLLEATDMPLGPVALDALRLGYDGALSGTVALRLAPPDELGFVRPAVALGASEDGISVVIEPLGPARRDDLSLSLAPDFALIAGPGAPAALIEDLGIPLAATILLRAFDDRLERPLWNGGAGTPSPRTLLDAAGLVRPGTRPPTLEPATPPPFVALLRALRALAGGVKIELGEELALALTTRDGRSGLRLSGAWALPGEAIDLDLRFGETADDGVTLWLIEDVTGTIPVRIAPALSIEGLGAVITGPGDRPLIEGALQIGGLGALLMLDVAFVDATGAPALEVGDPGAALELHDGRLKLAGDDGDSFLAEILPPEMEGPFELAIAWRDGRLRVTGGHSAAGQDLTVSYPLGVDLVIARLTELFLALRTEAERTRFEAAISADAALGPIAASVTRVGIAISAGDDGVSVGFRSPDGAGLALDGALVEGGGFLLRDDAAGQYVGVFELTIAETVSVNVVALISSKLPDGGPGFALLIVITAEGFAPIQLGMGFVLTGIGGLLALNRTVAVEAVRGGLKSGVLDSVLFPKDPVRNAGRLISTLNQVFPQAPDRLLLGPMVTIGWGSPTILTARVAVLIELPDPLRLVVLASVSAVLPNASNPIVQLRVDAVGALDFERGELSLDASIYDSRIWKFALTGDLALRLRWKHEPQFLLSVGGFHPRYAAPPGVPSLERVALTLSDTDNPRLRMECYFALTSNSIQFGARVELYAAAAGFEVSGEGGFDALIQWSPFRFAVDVYARLAVRFAGATIMAINLELGLSGPEPWRARGIAEIQFLLLKARVSFELVLGEDRDPPAPEEIDAGQLLADALGEAGSWSAVLPAAERPGVTLRDAGAEGVLAHPLATLTVRQRILPLDVAVTRLGAFALRGGARTYHLDVDGPRESTDGLVVAPVEDSFALGQFQARTDDQRLAERDFVPCTAGFSVAAGRETRLPTAQALDSSLRFETLVLDEDDTGPAQAGPPSSGLPGEIGVMTR